MLVPLKYTQVDGPAITQGAVTQFDTTGVVRLEIRAAVLDIAGGTGAAVYFYVDQQDAGSVWRPVWASEAIRTAETLTAMLGTGAGPTHGPVIGGVGRGGGVFALTMAAPNLARFGWTVTGSPTSITLDAVLGTQ